MLTELHGLCMGVIVENLREAALVGSDSPRPRDNAGDAGPTPFIPSNVGPEALVRSGEMSGGLAGQNELALPFTLFAVVALHTMSVQNGLDEAGIAPRPRAVGARANA